MVKKRVNKITKTSEKHNSVKKKFVLGFGESKILKKNNKSQKKLKTNSKDLLDTSNLLNKKSINVLSKLKDLIKYEKIRYIYIDFSLRIFIYVMIFAFLFTISYCFFSVSFSHTRATSVAYQEIGNADYKVYLKKNDFYEQSYLPKNKVYIANIINNINIDFNYQFIIDKLENMDFNYNVLARLSIVDETTQNVYYEKDYVILNDIYESINNKNSYILNKSISINYDYYNSLANKFRSSYGVDASSKLTIIFRINKNISDINLNSNSTMSVVIPLSKKTINISIDSNEINNSNSVVSQSKTILSNKIFIVISVVSFIISVAVLLRTLELLFKLIDKKSIYDKYLDKIFKEYDRLIVETKTKPLFDNKNVIRIGNFEELLDVRDTLKQPIMYYNISTHNKCNFYIKHNDDVYLTVLKAVDLEEKKNAKKKKNK